MLFVSPEEIADLADQISQGGKTIHELERMKKVLDVEKSDIKAALEEVEVSTQNCGWNVSILTTRVQRDQWKPERSDLTGVLGWRDPVTPLNVTLFYCSESGHP